jgi:hypothetical protein
MIRARNKIFASHTEIRNVEVIQERYCTSVLSVCRSAANEAEEWERVDKVAGERFCAVWNRFCKLNKRIK